MNHVNPEPLIDIQKVIIDRRQRLVILLERLEQYRLRLKEPPRDHHIRHVLQHPSPAGEIGTRVRRPQEDDAVRRHEDRPVILLVVRAHVVAVQQGALGDDAAEGVGDPDQREAVGAFGLAVRGQGGDEALGVHVDEVVRGGLLVLFVGVDVGVVAVDEDVGVGVLEAGGEEVGGPVDAGARGGPCLCGVAVEAMDEDDVGCGEGVVVDGGELVASNVFGDGPLGCC
jgi:hypothetical protein